MAGFIDFFNVYAMGSAQMLVGFQFLTRILHKEAKWYCYFLFAVCGNAIMQAVPAGRLPEFGAYALLLTVSGVLVCHGDVKSSLLFSALAVAVMHLCYGLVDSLLRILFPPMLMHSKIAGMVCMALGNTALLLAVLCYHVIYQHFSCYETIKKQYVLLVLIPVLMIFLTGEYLSSVLYGDLSVTDSSMAMAQKEHWQMLVLQLLELGSLFCVLFAYKKLLQSFRLSTELSLFQQQERFLDQYVVEAKARYEKTRSFRHDVKNHIIIVKELLQKGKTKEALCYLGDMEGMAEGLSFPCSTNNPVVDILAGNKLGLAKSMGIDVSCSLPLPYPCGLRDIDICIVLSNAFDNAIHACKTMDGSREKYIRVAGRIQGDFLFLEIENSFQGTSRFQAGTGLSNIKAVAEKYHGAMDIKAQGCVFSLSVLLIIPHHPGCISRQNGSSAILSGRET